MTENVELLNTLLATGGIVLVFAAGILIFDFVKERALHALVSVWGLFTALIITLSGSVMTLIYSEVFGFVPCGLCWLQRVFLYPQVVILALALYYHDKTAARYGIALSIPGALVGLYQHYLQMGGSEFVTCPTAGAGADCARRIMFEYGFVTFPLLSVMLFVFLIALYLYVLKTASFVRQED